MGYTTTVSGEIEINGVIRTVSYDTVYSPRNAIKCIIDNIAREELGKLVFELTKDSENKIKEKISLLRQKQATDMIDAEKKAKDILSQKKLIDLVAQWRNNIFIDIRM